MFAFLARVLLFFVTISVIRSVVQAILRAFRGTSGSRSTPNPPQAPGAASSGSPSSASAPSDATLLHQDPVCGTYVAPGSSLKKVCRGQVFHFCSEECRDRYQA